MNADNSGLASSRNNSELRADACDYLDKAQEALFDGDVSDEDALSHLDAALAVLNSMIMQPDTRVMPRKEFEYDFTEIKDE